MFASKDVFLTPPSTGGYTIARSVRLRSSASAYLNRTFGTPTNNTKWTMSMWLKRGSLGGSINIFGSVVTGGYFEFRFNTSDQIYIQNRVSSTNLLVANTTAVYRDPSAWYHIVFAFDSANATAANRNLLYVNGVNVSLSANSGSGDACAFNSSGNTQYIGNSDAYTTFDGYLTEVNFIDGQALTPSSFGSTNAITGVWQPAKYTGTYGTNGFYLNFSDNSSNTATTIGKDYSGNSNNWTPNNISVTAGATYDSMTDVPTLTSATAANYATLNPLIKPYGTNTFSNGNLQGSADANWNVFLATITVTSGKWYWEYVTSDSNSQCGIMSMNQDFTVINPQTFSSSIYYIGDGTKRIDNSITAYGASYGGTDTIGVALDFTGGTINFYKNNTSQGSINLSSSTNLVGKIIAPAFIQYSNTITPNFGQRPFSYTPPTGYVALNTYNLPASTITNGAKYMAASTYTGNLTGQSITNGGNNTLGTTFQPDLVWIKSRSAATDNKLTDSVRGATKALISNTTGAETTDATGVTAINSNGFTVGVSTVYNNTAVTYVSWQWQAGGTSSSNTNGSITSTVSVGATQGFSVVTYTGNSTNNATVGHGLGVVPSMIILKNRSGAYDWPCYHTSIGSGGYVYLNSTAAKATDANMWKTTPTSTVFTLGTYTENNGSSNNYVAYCFSAIAGFSAFGSYTGNGSTDGPFIYTGFRPRWVMWKNTSLGGTDWTIVDSSRNTYNVANSGLQPDGSYAEASNSNYQFDFLSNGFKVRTTNPEANRSGDTIIYACFAENPLKYALAR
jgi:hypothetical protein